MLGLISAARLCAVYVPPRIVRGRSAGSFPEQRLVIEPTRTLATVDPDVSLREGSLHGILAMHRACSQAARMLALCMLSDL